MMSLHKKELKKKFRCCLKEKEKGEIALSYIFDLKTYVWLSNKYMILQMKRWRKESKQGVFKICKYNNSSYECEGNSYYTLIAQPYKNGKLDVCIESVSCNISKILFDRWEIGKMFVFKRKENRDNIYNYVMKDIEEPKGRTDQENRNDIINFYLKDIEEPKSRKELSANEGD